MILQRSPPDCMNPLSFVTTTTPHPVMYFATHLMTACWESCFSIDITDSTAAVCVIVKYPLDGVLLMVMPFFFFFGLYKPSVSLRMYTLYCTIYRLRPAVILSS